MKRIDLKRTALGFVGVGALAAVIALLVGAFAGGESTATAKKNFCNSLTSFSSTVMNYEGLNLRTATNDQIEHPTNGVSNTWNNVVDEANDWVNADDNAATKAYNNLENAIDALPGDNTIAEDLVTL